jgi:hypothetical protein
MKKPDQLIHPQAIIDEHLRSALKPYAKPLLEAAACDKALEAEMDKAHPEGAKREAEQLFERACNGDREADGILVSAGGTAGFIENRSRFFDLARGKCRAKAKADAALWEKVALAADTALDTALGEVREQWAKVQILHGEEPRPSCYEDKIGRMRLAIGKSPFNARELMHGTNWQIESLGLRGALQ